MARTFIRQDTQIRKSDLYDDTITPSLANYETNPVNIEDDLNTLRSQVQNFLNRNGAGFPAGNWYDDLTAPVTFENGTQRGINTQNQQLHDLERKRVLVNSYHLVDVVVPASAFATGTLTSTANLADGDTVTIGAQTYTMKNPFVDAANNIDASVSQAQTMENLRRAINGNGVAGVNYGTGTPVNTNVTAVDSPTTVVVTAIVAGTAANLVATTETSANASWGAATLTGGAGDVSVLTLGQLPSNTTAAIGAVTTLGTVAAFNTNFGTISLAEVAGSTAISPKNLGTVVDGLTRDPILSSGRTIYALFQTESNTDGSTMTGTTPNRAQLSFVRINAAGDDLEVVPASDIGGKTINYSSVTRKALEDLTEQDFLKGAEIDVPSAATVTRQVSYDNQGTTAVELTTNATLDLNSAGIFWQIRDLVDAVLFRITEGSTGGTTTLQIGTDVDTFDVNSIINDFNTGIRAATGSTRIDVGVNAGVVETTGANDLRVLGAGELYLDDGNQTGSTWAQTNGIKLSDTTAEWNDYETAFGEVSLLRGIYLAYTNAARNDKVYANVTSTTKANNDVGGVGGGTNLDAQLPDMSTGDFLTDYDVFLNGNLLRPGANSGANNDYYPGTSLVNGQLRFEFTVKTNDVICVIPYI